jgi:hypothetical protein
METKQGRKRPVPSPWLLSLPRLNNTAAIPEGGPGWQLQLHSLHPHGKGEDTVDGCHGAVNQEAMLSVGCRTIKAAAVLNPSQLPGEDCFGPATNAQRTHHTPAPYAPKRLPSSVGNHCNCHGCCPNYNFASGGSTWAATASDHPAHSTPDRIAAVLTLLEKETAPTCDN